MLEMAVAGSMVVVARVRKRRVLAERLVVRKVVVSISANRGGLNGMDGNAFVSRI